MPAPIQCQRKQIDGVECTNVSKGFVLTAEDSAVAVWKSGLALCTACGSAVQAELDGSTFVTIDEIGDMMAEEQQGQAQGTTLHDLLAKFNQANADSSVPDVAQASDNPAVPDVPQPSSASKALLANQLRKDIAEAHSKAQQTQAIIDAMADLPEWAKVKLLEAVKGYEKAIAASEKQLAKLFEPAVRYTQAPEIVALRQSIYLGGLDALAAFDAALAAGLLGKKSAPKKVATDGVQSSSNEAGVRVRTVTVGRADNAERNATIEQRYREGHTEAKIREQRGLTAHPGIVTGVIGRAVDAGRLVRQAKAA